MASRNINPTLDQCKQWLRNTQINPLTGRRIMTYGTVYEAFKKKCSEYGLLVENTHECEAKWIELDANEASIYGKSLMTICKYCSSYMRLQFVHASTENDIADYECCRCNKDGNLGYLCIKCRNRMEE